MTLGKRIKEVRGKLARPKFAALFGLSRNTIQRYEIDEGPPDTNFIIALCERYKIRVEWLLCGIEPQKQGVKPVTAPAVLDQSILIDAIDTLEQVLQGTGKTMLAGDKAEIIAKIYELYIEENKGTDKEKLSNILKLVANYD